MSKTAVFFKWFAISFLLMGLLAGGGFARWFWQQSALGNNENAVAATSNFPIDIGTAPSTAAATTPEVASQHITPHKAEHASPAKPAVDTQHANATQHAAAPKITISPPDGSMLEETAYGTLPKISPNGQMPFVAYKAPAPSASGQKQVAVILTGGGLSATDMDFLLNQSDMPAVSVAVSPYAAGDVQAAVSALRQLRHEVWVDLPVEPLYPGLFNAGPLALNRKLGSSKLQDRLYTSLGRITSHTGAVISDKTTPFVSDRTMLEKLHEDLKSRGVAMAIAANQHFDVGSNANEHAASKAPLLLEGKFITPDLSSAASVKQAVATISQAITSSATSSQQPPVLILPVNRLTVQALIGLGKAQSQLGIQLVPVSVFVATAAK